MAAKKSFDLNPIYEAAHEVQSFCIAHRWKLCFIGGVAVQRWGEPRVTLDADLTLLTGFGDENNFIKPLLEEFAARRPDADQFARVNRVLLLTASNNIPIDIGLGALPFEENTIERASRFNIGENRFLITCCAEDLVVHKAFANRINDWADLDRILMRQRGKLNFELIWRELRPLRRHSFQPLWDRRAYIQQHQRLTILRTTIKSILVADDHPSFARACAH